MAGVLTRHTREEDTEQGRNTCEDRGKGRRDVAKELQPPGARADEQHPPQSCGGSRALQTLVPNLQAVENTFLLLYAPACDKGWMNRRGGQTDIRLKSKKEVLKSRRERS